MTFLNALSFTLCCMSHVISPRLVCVHVYLYLDQGHMSTWVWSQDRVVLYTAILMGIHFVNEV